MNRKHNEFDLLVGSAVAVSMAMGAILTFHLGSVPVVCGSAVWGVVVVCKYYYIRRMNATNDRSTSQDIDV